MIFKSRTLYRLGGGGGKEVAVTNSNDLIIAARTPDHVFRCLETSPAGFLSIPPVSITLLTCQTRVLLPLSKMVVHQVCTIHHVPLATRSRASQLAVSLIYCPCLGNGLNNPSNGLNNQLAGCSSYGKG